MLPDAVTPGSATYLGTAEDPDQTSIAIESAWTPVFSDKRGPRLPATMLHGGEQAFIDFALNVWVEQAYARLAARPTIGDTRGKVAAADIGAMLMEDGLAFTLWLQFPYADLSAYAGMPKGYRFPGCYLQKPDRLTSLGTTDRLLSLGIHALEVADADGNLTLYDHNVDGLPGIPLA